MIDEGLLGALKAMYAAAGMVTIASYAPQIRAVWRSETGATDVSLIMWGLWSAAALIAVGYACVVTHDPGYVLMSLGNAVGCLLVTALTALKRSQARHRHIPHG